MNKATFGRYLGIALAFVIFFVGLAGLTYWRQKSAQTASGQLVTTQPTVSAPNQGFSGTGQTVSRGSYLMRVYLPNPQIRLINVDQLHPTYKRGAHQDVVNLTSAEKQNLIRLERRLVALEQQLKEQARLARHRPSNNTGKITLLDQLADLGPVGFGIVNQ
ncbi:MAG: hypothetical protein CEO22_18 [Candidatus Berkelbacteria bacterium Gr01-1014_85]|uniref:Uncharacterized protein n=1 Tax=Candidatus Berkelbacteria bacterium Gr01-1014_85 TaxID=2017150 RepID=A0A554JE12_9BACT|nr:MAG: hypothetical protein CEO22_18 [Candidatus Berkelbacteria bacterium Gr01-1014_85]